MPLPDERPRQSVANLIGRFEKQKSSTGPSTPPISFPRTSSVASHRTGDSAQEEVKEKREWPPRSADSQAASVSSQVQPLPSFTPSVDKSIIPVPPRASPPAPAPGAALAPPPDQPPSQSIPAKAKTPRPSHAVSAKVKSPPPSQLKSASTRTSTLVKSPTPKAAAKTASEGSLKPQSSGASAPSTSTALKPQHTGQSTTSTQTANRAAAKPRASAPPKAPAVTTPARSRTPLTATRPKTPSSAPRARTPLSNARPKTPSGLYAPTAASLARSKAGAPAPPPVEKPKRKVTTDLSKPTAASASRIRSPALVPPAKAGKPSVVKATGAKTAVKSTVSKPATPAKRPAAAKPRVAAVVDDKVGTKESNAEAPAVVEVAVPASELLVEDVAVGGLDEISQQDLPDAVSDVGDVLEGEPEDIDHPTAAHDESPLGEEHLELNEQPDSQEDEEIENYDEDFPDDIPHGTHVNPANGHSVEDVGNQLVEEPIEEHVSVPDDSLHDDDAPTLAQGDHDLPESEELPAAPAESHDVVSRLDHLDDSETHDVVEDQPEKVAAKGPQVGSDLEDIVNLLESGPQIPKPSLESSPAGGTVSEAGDIPDEY